MSDGRDSERRLTRLRELCDRLALVAEMKPACEVAVDVLGGEFANVAIYLFDGSMPQLAAKRGNVMVADECLLAVSTYIDGNTICAPIAKVASRPHGLLVVTVDRAIDDNLRGFVELSAAMIAATLLAAS